MSDTKNPPQSSLLVKQKLDPVLIVDPSAEFLESMYMDVQAQRIPPMAAQTFKEAQTLIAQFKEPFAGIFVNPDIDQNAMSLLNFAKHHKPNTPTYLIYDAESKAFKPNSLGPAELKKLGVQKVLKKPVSYSDMLKMVTSAALIFDPNDALTISKNNTDAVDQEISVQDDQFFPAQASDFLSGAKSYFDVYVRLSSGKYIKILKAGDSFTSDRLGGYLSKGVTHFYMRKEIQQHYLNYSDKIAGALLRSPKIPEKLKISQTLHQGELTIQFLKDYGIGEAGVQFAETFVENVDTLVKQLNLSKSDAIKDFLKDIAAYQHGVSVVLVSSLLIRTLNFEYGKAVNTVGLASLLHDLGVDSQNPKFVAEDEDKMDAAEKKTFQTHPRTGGILLKNTRGVNPLVAQAVEQHHERRNRTGFPNALGPGAIILAAEIVGISDEICHSIVRNAEFKNHDPCADLERRKILEGFSPAIVEAFKSAFNKGAPKT